jgi:hypothetical protein
METCPVAVFVGFPLTAGVVVSIARLVVGTLLTYPVPQSCYLLKALEAFVETIQRGELLQLHHDLESLRVALNVKEHQLGAECPYRANPS